MVAKELKANDGKCYSKFEVTRSHNTYAGVQQQTLVIREGWRSAPGRRFEWESIEVPLDLVVAALLAGFKP